MKKNNISKKNRLIFVCLLIVFIVFFAFYYYYNYINFIPKTDNKKDYIYTASRFEDPYEEDSYDEVPAINLEGEKFDKINAAILENYNSVRNMNEYDYKYEYSISKNILALKIAYGYYSDSSLEPNRYFQTFNIDLRNGHFLTNSEILDKYKLKEDDVNEYLKYQFRQYYNNLVEGEFYTKEECDYNCFLKNRGITGKYTDDISYYIQDGVLTAFKFFYTRSDYEEEQYFVLEDYQFVIKEKY